MNNSEAFEYNDSGLEDLVKMFSEDMPIAKVGILGAKNSREDKGTNVAIGKKHEFGEEGMPERSFLRVPLMDNMERYMRRAGAFNKDMFKQLLKEKSFVPFVQKMAILGEAIVSDAFDSEGFGKWKPSNMKFKKNHQTLVETQQLRNSITSEVVEND